MMNQIGRIKFCSLPVYKCLSASLLEHCQYFPREDMCLIFALGSVSRNTVLRAVFPNTLLGSRILDNMISVVLLIQYLPMLPRNTSQQCNEC